MNLKHDHFTLGIDLTRLPLKMAQRNPLPRMIETSNRDLPVEMIASPVYTEPLRVAQIMAGFRYPWVVCGGWAIDLFIKRISRQHQDVDIGIWRPDQLALRTYLVARGWTPEKAIDGQTMKYVLKKNAELYKRLA
jgi:hypothetical protein